MELLAEIDDLDVQIAVANNPSTPIGGQRKLVSSQNRKIRVALALNGSEYDPRIWIEEKEWHGFPDEEITDDNELNEEQNGVSSEHEEFLKRMNPNSGNFTTEKEPVRGNVKVNGINSTLKPKVVEGADQDDDWDL